MTERKIAEQDLAKALKSLQDLAKGSSSGDTATTRVPSMVAESGPTQLFHTANSSDPGGWAGSSWDGESWDDMVASNGTDVVAMKKMAKSIFDKMTKGQSLTAHEVDFVSKGGMNFLDKKVDKAYGKDEDEPVKKARKMMADDEDVKKARKMADDDLEKAEDEEEDEDEEHEDEAQDKKMVREMVKPSAMKKSFLDHAVETPAMQAGLEVSEFLAGFAQVMHKSLQSMEARITDRVLVGLSRTAQEQSTVQKSMAEAVASLGEVLSYHAQRLEQVEAGPARAPKSADVSKSLQGGYQSDDIGSLSKSQISDKLFELVQKSQATPNDILKFDATGEISPDLARKVLGR